MSTKSRGTNAERDLIHKFWENGWAAIRAAGSGSQQYPSPDVLVSNNLRKLAIEVKLTTKERQYFTREEITELLYFCEKFGAEAWLAVKFFRQQWYFFSIEDATATAKAHVITLEQAVSRGIAFEELLT